MNILKSILPGMLFCTPFLTTAGTFANAGAPVHGYSIDEMEASIRCGITEVVHIVKPLYNGRVRSYLRSYIELSPQQTEIMMGRAEMYFELFEACLDRHDMPRDLKYLAVVESALIPGAVSHSGAGGIWQFMRATGREYGLRITQYIDERRDPAESTEAAVRYLKKLYDRFGTWELAMAAYNAGPGRVNSAIRRSGTRDYWKLSRYLPRETRSYVPGFIAVNYLFERYADHNLEPQLPDEELLVTSEIRIHDGVSLLDVSKITGVPYNTIKILNPIYYRRYIPRSATGSILRLPNYAIGVMQEHLGHPDINEELLASLVSFVTGPIVDFEKPVIQHTYDVVHGDNLYGIAQAHGCLVRKLMQWNDLKSAQIDIGQELIIYTVEHNSTSRQLEDRVIQVFPRLEPIPPTTLTAAPRTLYCPTPGPAEAVVSIPRSHVMIRRRKSLKEAIKTSRSCAQVSEVFYASTFPESSTRFRE